MCRRGGKRDDGERKDKVTAAAREGKVMKRKAGGRSGRGEKDNGGEERDGMRKKIG